MPFFVFLKHMDHFIMKILSRPDRKNTGNEQIYKRIENLNRFDFKSFLYSAIADHIDLSRVNEENIFKKKLIPNRTLIRIINDKSIDERSDAYLVIDGYDFSDVNIKEILSKFADVKYKKLQQADNTIIEENVKRIRFFNCIFDKINFGEIRPFQKDRNLNIKYIECRIYDFENGSAHAESNQFINCDFTYYKQLYREHTSVKISDHKIKTLILRTKHNVDLIDSQINLLCHGNLNELNINATNTTILFDENLVRALSKNEHKDYWNTFNALLLEKSVSSERYEIEKYVAFFSSRDHKFKRLLFWFHQSYTRIWVPFIAMIIFALLNCIILQFMINDSTNMLTRIIFPNLLLKEVVLKDFHLTLNHNAISLPKLVIIMFEVVFYYSLFCWAFAFKKKFGFSANKT